MVHNATNIPAKSVKQIFLRKGMCFNRSLRLKHIPFLKISVLLTDWSLYCLPVCSVTINLTFNKIITQTKTNA